MAVTFIGFNEKGFWIHENFMQLAYYYIYEELTKEDYSLRNKEKMLDTIKFHLNGYSSGSMSLGWYNILESENDIEIMTKLLHNLEVILGTKGKEISADELKSISSRDNDFKNFYRKPFPTKELIKIISALKEMLDGSWKFENFEMKIEYL